MASSVRLGEEKPRLGPGEAAPAVLRAAAERGRAEGRVRDATARRARARYTAFEHQALGKGLRTLRTDVNRLIDKMDDASDCRDEITDAVVAYKNYESRYRGLRAMDKQVITGAPGP